MSLNCPIVLLLGTLVGVGCSSSAGDGGDGDGDGDTCVEHTQCDLGENCNESGVCESSSTGSPCLNSAQCRSGEECIGSAPPKTGFCGCEGEQFTAEEQPPNVLVLLDRSGSMAFKIDGARKLDIAKAAIDQLVTAYPSIRYGFSIYPAVTLCGPGSLTTPANVEIDDNTADAVREAANAATPAGDTPIRDTLEAFLEYEGLLDPTRQNYIVLITDGAEKCSPDAPSDPAAAHLAQGTKTFVVGFGSGVDADELNAIATAGGTARPGAEKYYQADNATELGEVLTAIGQSVLGCTYSLDADEFAEVVVHFDDVGVVEDPVNGWTYDSASMTLTFNGTSCDQLRSGAIEDLNIVNSCPAVID